MIGTFVPNVDPGALLHMMGHVFFLQKKRVLLDCPTIGHVSKMLGLQELDIIKIITSKKRIIFFGIHRKQFLLSWQSELFVIRPGSLSF